MAIYNPYTTGGGRRTGARPTSSAIRVSGAELTVKNMQDVDQGAVYISAFINRNTAFAVLNKSFDNVPFKTGELMSSGTVGTVEGFATEAAAGSEMFGGRMPNPSVEELTRGMDGENAITSVSFRSGIATRRFNRYWAGYTDDKAPVVHENPEGWQYKQHKGPRPDPPKTAHFLRNAYNAYEPYFTAAHKAGVQAVLDAINKRALAQRQSLIGSLASGGAKPRLVRPGGR